MGMEGVTENKRAEAQQRVNLYQQGKSYHEIPQ
jgi:hypothetical protein